MEQELWVKYFFRINQKFIIPMKAIKKIVLYSNFRLKVILPSYGYDAIILSREKVADSKVWILE